MAKFVQPDKETFNLSAVQGQFPKKSWRASLFSLCLLPLQDTVSYARHRQALTKVPAVIIHMRTRLPSCIQRLNLRHAVAYFRIPREAQSTNLSSSEQKEWLRELVCHQQAGDQWRPYRKNAVEFSTISFYSNEFET